MIRSIESEKVLTFFSRTHFHLFQVFSDEGKFLFKFGSKGRGDGQMSFPEGIVFLDWANGVLIADEGNNRVRILELSFQSHSKHKYFIFFEITLQP